MKKPYEPIDLEIVRYGAEDVISTSSEECWPVEEHCACTTEEVPVCKGL